MSCFFEDNPEDVQAVVAILKRGGVVAVPTETVYGLAADALNPDACRQIFEIKRRPLIDPLIVHVYDVPQAAALAYFSPLAERLAQTFWPGPLTLVLPKKSQVPDLITAGRETVGLRIPQHPLLRKVLRLSGLPLAAPSANPFGSLSPTTAQHVRNSLEARAPYILDGGACAVGVESTIVDMSRSERPLVLRPGPISADALTSVLGVAPLCASISGTVVSASIDDGVGGGLPAPGLLSGHYRPRTPLFLLKKGGVPPEGMRGDRFAWVRFVSEGAFSGSLRGVESYCLSKTGCLAEGARRLFALLHMLDSLHYTAIYVTELPNNGMGVAMNDRLQRASVAMNRH